MNDVFVMTEWKKASGAEGKIEFLADGNGDFAKALDLTMDGSAGGLGLRSKRYAMLVDNGVVAKLNVEEAPGKAETSSAEALLKQLELPAGQAAITGGAVMHGRVAGSYGAVPRGRPPPRAPPADLASLAPTRRRAR